MSDEAGDSAVIETVEQSDSVVEETTVTEADEANKKEDEEIKANTTEDKAEVRKRRVFVHPIIPRDLNDPALRPFLDKATLVISRFIGVKGAKKRGHVVLWYKTADEAAEMAEELKTIAVGERNQPLTVRIAESVTVPVGMIMEDWNQHLQSVEETAAKQRKVFVNNFPPGTPKELVRVLFPVATSIEISEDEGESHTNHAVLTFENKREAEICIKNATGIKVSNHSLTLHLVETEEELKKAKEDAERYRKEAEEKKLESNDAKEIEKEKRDIDREAKASEREQKEEEDANRKRKTKDDKSSDETKRPRSDHRSDRSHGYRRGGGGGGQWRSGGGFGGGSFGGAGGDSSLMGLLNTLQQVQQLQRGSRGGSGSGNWW